MAVCLWLLLSLGLTAAWYGLETDGSLTMCASYVLLTFLTAYIFCISVYDTQTNHFLSETIPQHRTVGTLAVDEKRRHLVL